VFLGEGDMAVDFGKEEKEFLDDLNAGKYKVERCPNTSDDYQNYEDRDRVAFEKYLKSAAFKALDSEASK
jgi:hypothetical protein